MNVQMVVACLVNARLVEIGLILSLLAVLFIVVERLVTLLLLANRRILNGSLAVIARKSSRPEFPVIAGNYTCLLAATLRSSATPDELRQSLDTHFHRLNRPTAVLRLIAGIAPLGGLLGTILGIMVTMESPEAKSGIATALSTTALGIVVTISALLAAYAAEERLSRLIDRIEEICLR